MKKFVYLSGMMLLGLNLMAQIDLNDKNWDTLFIEDFSVVRTWSSNKWQDGSTDATSIWRCFPDESWPDGVTTSVTEHRQAYQPNNAVFGLDGTMKLVGVFKGENPLQCGVRYDHAPWSGTGHYCDPIIANQHPAVHYHAGMIETITPIGYGYYEIKCKMPIHNGNKSSFWFWSNIGGTYNEIDVFEHAKNHSADDLERTFLSGIWYNPLGTNSGWILDNSGHVIQSGANRYAEKRFTLPDSSPTLDKYHIFGCLWMPERMAIFCDGELVTECTDPDQIPPHSMKLKISSKEDLYAYNTALQSWWAVNDTMTVDYVKAYRFKTDCNTDTYIRSLTDFNSYFYSVKHSITMGATTGVLSIPDNKVFTMRAVNSIVIDGGFEVPTGTSMTLITQECPFCSDD